MSADTERPVYGEQRTGWPAMLARHTEPGTTAAVLVTESGRTVTVPALITTDEAARLRVVRNTVEPSPADSGFLLDLIDRATAQLQDRTRDAYDLGWEDCWTTRAPSRWFARVMVLLCALVAVLLGALVLVAS